MAATRVQAKGKNNASATTAIAVGAGDGLSTITAANLIVVLVGQFGGTPSAPTISDNIDGATNWVTDLSAVARTSLRMTMMHKANAPSGITTITVTPGSVASVCVIEYSGVATSPTIVKVAAYTDQPGVTSFASNQIITSVQSLLVGFAATIFSASAGFAASGSWSSGIDFANSSDGDDAWFEEQLNAAANTYQATGTNSSLEISAGAISFSLATSSVTPANDSSMWAHPTNQPLNIKPIITDY